MMSASVPASLDIRGIRLLNLAMDEALVAIEAALAAQMGSRVVLELPFGSLEDARARILPWGGATRVLSPVALRESLADYARQTAARYGG